jgi:hypothetical protein
MPPFPPFLMQSVAWKATRECQRFASWLHLALLEHDPEKWIPVFGKRSPFNKNLERDVDSTQNHRALKHHPEKRAPVFG